MVCSLQKHDGRVWAQVTLALNLRQPGAKEATESGTKNVAKKEVPVNLKM
jgi:hypothetical protein